MEVDTNKGWGQSAEHTRALYIYVPKWGRNTSKEKQKVVVNEMKTIPEEHGVLDAKKQKGFKERWSCV